MKTIGVLLATALLALAGFAVASPSNVNAIIDTIAAGDDVCPAFDTGHISGGGQTSITITAPAGQVIVAICVKAGSAQQGEGPEIITPPPGTTTYTFSHSSGKEISHYSVDYGPADETTTTETTTTETTTTQTTTTETTTTTEPPTTTETTTTTTTTTTTPPPPPPPTTTETTTTTTTPPPPPTTPIQPPATTETTTTQPPTTEPSATTEETETTNTPVPPVDGSSPPSDPSEASPPPEGELPLTGFSLLGIVLLGLVLSGAGLLLRLAGRFGWLA